MGWTLLFTSLLAFQGLPRTEESMGVTVGLQHPWCPQIPGLGIPHIEPCGIAMKPLLTTLEFVLYHSSVSPNFSLCALALLSLTASDFSYFLLQ